MDTSTLKTYIAHDSLCDKGDELLFEDLNVDEDDDNEDSDDESKILCYFAPKINIFDTRFILLLFLALISIISVCIVTIIYII